MLRASKYLKVNSETVPGIANQTVNDDFTIN
jgi:hypothetical protein